MQRRFVRPLFFLLACLPWAASNAQADSPWVRVLQNEQGTYYLNPKTVTSKGKVKNFWSLRDYPQTQATFDGKAFRSTLAHIELDCASQEALVLEISYFSEAMGTGDKVLKEKDFHNAQPVDPRSPIYRFAQRLCK